MQNGDHFDSASAWVNGEFIMRYNSYTAIGIYVSTTILWSISHSERASKNAICPRCNIKQHLRPCSVIACNQRINHQIKVLVSICIRNRVLLSKHTIPGSTCSYHHVYYNYQIEIIKSKIDVECSQCVFKQNLKRCLVQQIICLHCSKISNI